MGIFKKYGGAGSRHGGAGRITPSWVWLRLGWVRSSPS